MRSFSIFPSIEFGDDLFFKDLKEFAGKDSQIPEQFIPTIDFIEREKEYLLEFDLPGVLKKDIQIDVVEFTLSLKTIREKTYEEKGHSEKKYGQIKRKLNLPKNSSPSEIEASFENGVLSLKIPKLEKLSPRKISIRP